MFTLEKTNIIYNFYLYQLRFESTPHRGALFKFVGDNLVEELNPKSG